MTDRTHDTPPSTAPHTSTATRRTFLGWLGAATGLAVYATHQIPTSHLDTIARPAQVVPPSRSDTPAPTFEIHNESQDVMIVHYARTDTTRFDRPPAPARTAHPGRSERHQTEAILLPGERLTITAISTGMRAPRGF